MITLFNGAINLNLYIFKIKKNHILTFYAHLKFYLNLFRVPSNCFVREILVIQLE